MTKRQRCGNAEGLLIAALLNGEKVKVGSKKDRQLLTCIDRVSYEGLTLSDDISINPNFQTDTRYIAREIEKYAVQIKEPNYAALMIGQVQLLRKCATSNDYKQARVCGATLHLIVSCGIDNGFES